MAFEISNVSKICNIVRILSFNACEAINLWTFYVHCICKNSSGIQEEMMPNIYIKLENAPQNNIYIYVLLKCDSA